MEVKIIEKAVNYHLEITRTDEENLKKELLIIANVTNDFKTNEQAFAYINNNYPNLFKLITSLCRIY